ncbi:B3/4 domain-containing protein [uncultured Slackia sp.]|uniref:B3/B4 domain-containing protein n=1 Tax=uncultured Slackia sp. TaxID=665903 RepID=UPI0026207B1B|nr:B3/4 domain-containing protein [uncultured Slackia sp.]
MQFIVEDSFWELFPDATIGILAVRGLKSADEIPSPQLDALSRLLVAANGMAQLHLSNSNIAENDVIRVWRDAYRLFKTKKGARSSIENLLKRVLKNNPVKSINPLVDIYNIVSLKHALPVGGEDLDTFVGDLRLCVTEGGDDFQPLGSWEKDPTLPGEVCYLDDEGAVCRCWNWRDGERTALSDNTENAFLIIENVDPARHKDLEAAVEELSALVQHNLGATVTTHAIVSKENPSVTLA